MIFTNRITAIFRIVVEFGPLRYITPKLTYVLPSATAKFIVSSVCATCFGRADHPQAFKYMNLNPEIK